MTAPGAPSQASPLPGTLPPAGQAPLAAVPAHQDRAAYLAAVRPLLWPEVPGGRAAEAAPARPAASRGLIVLPGAARPRIVVPASRRAGAAALRRYGEPGSVRARSATRLLSLLLRAGFGGVLGDTIGTGSRAGTPAIESYLEEQLGQAVSVSMHLGAARANRKPVLQLLTADGTTIGFAKIGINQLTRELVRAERDALTQLGSLPLARLEIPAVLHSGSWRDLEVLVLSALPVWQRRVPPAPGELAAAMRELAASAGLSAGPLAGSQYWQRLAGRAAAAGDTADCVALRTAMGTTAARSAGIELSFGCWHGDWTPWNMASVRSGLLVWDWERFTTGVPVGFDALHYWLQARVVSARANPRAAAAECIGQAPALLAQLGLDAGQARLTALAYLADLSARYLADRQAEAGARLGAPGQWLIPALSAGAAQL